MSHDDAPWAPMADDVVERLRGELAPKHDRIIRELTENRRELTENRRELAEVRQELARAHDERDELRARLDDEIKRIAELAEHYGLVEAIAQYLGRAAANGQLPPELITAITEQTPRPPSIDRACAADPNGPPQRVHLPQYGKTVIVKQGSDPEVTWRNIASLGEGIDNDVEKKTPHHSHRA